MGNTLNSEYNDDDCAIHTYIYDAPNKVTGWTLAIFVVFVNSKNRVACDVSWCQIAAKSLENGKSACLIVVL